MKVKAGALNSRVTIQSQSSTQDAAGQPVLTWTDMATVWANVRHPRGAESIQADAETSIVKASIRIRKRTGITSAMRVVFGDRVYSIKAVLPDDVELDKMDLVCEATNA